MPQKIRAAFFIDKIITDLGGTEKQLLETIRRLDRGKFEPFLIFLTETPWMRGNPHLPCESVVLGFDGFLKPSFPRVVSKFRALLRQKRFHIIHTFFNEATLLCFLSVPPGARRPALLSSRRDIGMGNSVPWYHSLYRWLMPAVNRRFDGIVINGNNIKGYVLQAEGVPENRLKVIHNGIDLPSPSVPLPRIFQENNADFWVGITANLKPVKRLDVFLRALALLRDEHGIRNFRAIVMGEGRERPALESLSGDLGLRDRVHFLGAIGDVFPYLQGLDAAVLCSDKEGFSNALLEYMACGLPVVTTSVGGNTELIDDSNGICIPPGDAMALSAALARLAGDPSLRKAWGLRSRKRVESAYSWTRCMAELESYYQAIVSRRLDSALSIVEAPAMG